MNRNIKKSFLMVIFVWILCIKSFSQDINSTNNLTMNSHSQIRMGNPKDSLMDDGGGDDGGGHHHTPVPEAKYGGLLFAGALIGLIIFSEIRKNKKSI